MDAEHAARNILRNCVHRAPQAGHAIMAAMQSDDEQIDLVLACEADDGIHRFSIHQMSDKFDTLAQCSRSRGGLQLLIEFLPIVFEDDGDGGIRAGCECCVGWELLHHGNGLKPYTQSFRKMNRSGQGAAGLQRFVIGYGNVSKHLPPLSAGEARPALSPHSCYTLMYLRVFHGLSTETLSLMQDSPIAFLAREWFKND